MSKKGIWITWENQRRNRGISLRLDFKLFVIFFNSTRIIRYVKSICKTLLIIIYEKPQVVVAQNPSIILASYVVMLKYVFHYTCVIDAHNAGLFPYENKYKILNIISKKIQRYADITIVTNSQLALEVKSNGGSAIILPDRIPTPPTNIRIKNLKGNINIAFICSFSSDEPFNEVFEAAKSLPKDICIYVTGGYLGKVDPITVSSNLLLLGFLPEEEYWSIISSVDGIMVLTTRENCLVCGAYEAVSLKKPMILSQTDTIMNYFDLGSVYVEPFSENIRNGILKFVEQNIMLSNEVRALESKLKIDWEIQFAALVDKIDCFK